MRLLETFQDQSSAQAFQNYLAAQNIEASIEPYVNQETQKEEYLIWVHDEDQIDRALELLKAFKEDPKKATAETLKSPCDQQGSKSEAKENSDDQLIKGPIKVKVTPRLMNIRGAAPVTKWIIILCAVLFFWNSYQKISLSKEYPALMAYLNLTPLDKALVYDVPIAFDLLEQFFEKYPNIDLEKLGEQPLSVQKEFQNIEQTPSFTGIYEMLVDKLTNQPPAEGAILFRKIRQGQLWRTFTPCLLHRGLLHILFNMLWLWLLGRQVEQKVGKIRYLLIMIVIGVFSNTLQYLMSGPYFLGYSGVIAGLGGFIWIRQRVAPWEGYNIQTNVLGFLGIFILAMSVLQVIAFFLRVFDLATFNIAIANTAHISGALSGMVLAKIPGFYKVRS